MVTVTIGFNLQLTSKQVETDTNGIVDNIKTQINDVNSELIRIFENRNRLLNSHLSITNTDIEQERKILRQLDLIDVKGITLTAIETGTSLTPSLTEGETNELAIIRATHKTVEEIVDGDTSDETLQTAVFELPTYIVDLLSNAIESKAAERGEALVIDVAAVIQSITSAISTLQDESGHIMDIKRHIEDPNVNNFNKIKQLFTLNVKDRVFLINSINEVDRNRLLKIVHICYPDNTEVYSWVDKTNKTQRVWEDPSYGTSILNDLTQDLDRDYAMPLLVRDGRNNSSYKRNKYNWVRFDSKYNHYASILTLPESHMGKVIVSGSTKSLESVFLDDLYIYIVTNFNKYGLIDSETMDGIFHFHNKNPKEPFSQNNSITSSYVRQSYFNYHTSSWVNILHGSTGRNSWYAADQKGISFNEFVRDGSNEKMFSSSFSADESAVINDVPISYESGSATQPEYSSTIYSYRTESGINIDKTRQKSSEIVRDFEYNGKTLRNYYTLGLEDQYNEFVDNEIKLRDGQLRTSDVGEIMFFNKSLSKDERLQIKEYLNYKWDFTERIDRRPILDKSIINKAALWFDANDLYNLKQTETEINNLITSTYLELDNFQDKVDFLSRLTTKNLNYLSDFMSDNVEYDNVEYNNALSLATILDEEKYEKYIADITALSKVENIQIDASGTSGYIFPDMYNNILNPTITLVRGNIYNFKLNISDNGGHPLRIQSDDNDTLYSNGLIYKSPTNEYLTDISAQNQKDGILTFMIPTDISDTLYYKCDTHSHMKGTINIIDNSNRTIISNLSENNEFSQNKGRAVTEWKDKSPSQLTFTNGLDYYDSGLKERVNRETSYHYHLEQEQICPIYVKNAIGNMSGVQFSGNNNFMVSERIPDENKIESEQLYLFVVIRDGYPGFNEENTYTLWNRGGQRDAGHVVGLNHRIAIRNNANDVFFFKPPGFSLRPRDSRLTQTGQCLYIAYFGDDDQVQNLNHINYQEHIEHKWNIFTLKLEKRSNSSWYDIYLYRFKNLLQTGQNTFNYIWNDSNGVADKAFTIGGFFDSYNGSYAVSNQSRSFWAGIMGEVIIFNKPLDSNEVESVQEYLNKKWKVYPSEISANALDSLDESYRTRMNLWLDANDIVIENKEFKENLNQLDEHRNYILNPMRTTQDILNKYNSFTNGISGEFFRIALQESLPINKQLYYLNKVYYENPNTDNIKINKWCDKTGNNNHIITPSKNYSNMPILQKNNDNLNSACFDNTNMLIIPQNVIKNPPINNRISLFIVKKQSETGYGKNVLINSALGHKGQYFLRFYYWTEIGGFLNPSNENKDSDDILPDGYDNVLDYANFQRELRLDTNPNSNDYTKKIHQFQATVDLSNDRIIPGQENNKFAKALYNGSIFSYQNVDSNKDWLLRWNTNLTIGIAASGQGINATRAQNFQANGFAGNIYEIIMVKDHLTQNEEKHIREYLATKWNAGSTNNVVLDISENVVSKMTFWYDGNDIFNLDSHRPKIKDIPLQTINEDVSTNINIELDIDSNDSYDNYLFEIVDSYNGSGIIDGSYVIFTPSPDYYGEGYIRVKAINLETELPSKVKTINFNILWQNDPPIVSDISLSMDQKSTININLSDKYSDADFVSYTINDGSYVEIWKDKSKSELVFGSAYSYYEQNPKLHNSYGLNLSLDFSGLLNHHWYYVGPNSNWGTPGMLPIYEEDVFGPGKPGVRFSGINTVLQSNGLGPDAQHKLGENTTIFLALKDSLPDELMHYRYDGERNDELNYGQGVVNPWNMWPVVNESNGRMTGPVISFNHSKRDTWNLRDKFYLKTPGINYGIKDSIKDIEFRWEMAYGSKTPYPTVSNSYSYIQEDEKAKYKEVFGFDQNNEDANLTHKYFIDNSKNIFTFSVDYSNNQNYEDMFKMYLHTFNIHNQQESGGIYSWSENALDEKFFFLGGFPDDYFSDWTNNNQSRNFWSGYIGEIIIINEELQPDEIKDIQHYLNKKWGIYNDASSNDAMDTLRDDLKNKTVLWLDAMDLMNLYHETTTLTVPWIDNTDTIPHDLSGIRTNFDIARDLDGYQLSLNPQTQILTFTPPDSFGNQKAVIPYKVTDALDASNVGYINIYVERTYNQYAYDSAKLAIQTIVDDDTYLGLLDSTKEIYRELAILDIDTKDYILNQYKQDDSDFYLYKIDISYAHNLYNELDTSSVIINKIIDLSNLPTDISRVESLNLENYNDELNIRLALENSKYDNINWVDTMLTEEINNHKTQLLSAYPFPSNLNKYKDFIEIDLIVREPLLLDISSDSSTGFLYKTLISVDNSVNSEVIKNAENSLIAKNTIDEKLNAFNALDYDIRKYLRLKFSDLRNRNQQWMTDLLVEEKQRLENSLTSNDNSDLTKFQILLEIDIELQQEIIDTINENGQQNSIENILTMFSFVNNTVNKSIINDLQTNTTYLNTKFRLKKFHEYYPDTVQFDDFNVLHRDAMRIFLITSSDYKNLTWVINMINLENNNIKPIVGDIKTYVRKNESLDISLIGISIEDYAYEYGYELSFNIITEPTHDIDTSFSLNNNIVKYTKNNDDQNDYFTYRTFDSYGLSSELATVSIILIEQTLDLSYILLENTSFEFDIIYPQIPFGLPNTNYDISINNNVLYGEIDANFNTNKKIKYTPTSNYFGNDILTYSILESGIIVIDSTINYTIIEDKPPIVENLSLTYKNRAIDIELIGYDKFNGTGLSYEIISFPQHGTLTHESTLLQLTDIFSTNIISYLPETNKSDDVTIQYVAYDSNDSSSNTATINITYDQNYSNELTGLHAHNRFQMVNISSVFNEVVLLGSDGEQDVSSSEIQSNLQFIKVNDPSNGTLQVLGNKFYYTPQQRYDGFDEFDYKVKRKIDDTESDSAKAFIIVKWNNDLANTNIINL